jgi:hypothetical protein
MLVKSPAAGRIGSGKPGIGLIASFVLPRRVGVRAFSSRDTDQPGGIGNFSWAVRFPHDRSPYDPPDDLVLQVQHIASRAIIMIHPEIRAGFAIVDSTTENFVFELTGSSEKLNAFIALMEPLCLIEISHRGGRDRARRGGLSDPLDDGFGGGPGEAMIQIDPASSLLNLLWQGGGRTVGGSIVGCSQVADRVVYPRLQRTKDIGDVLGMDGCRIGAADAGMHHIDVAAAPHRSGL